FFAAANNGELQPLSAEDFDRSGAGIGVRLETKRANGFWIRIDRPGARAPMDLETVRFEMAEQSSEFPGAEWRWHIRWRDAVVSMTGDVRRRRCPPSGHRVASQVQLHHELRKVRPELRVL